MSAVPDNISMDECLQELDAFYARFEEVLDQQDVARLEALVKARGTMLERLRPLLEQNPLPRSEADRFAKREAALLVAFEHAVTTMRGALGEARRRSRTARSYRENR